MPVYVSLLRGINVGGHNVLPMTDLKMLCQDIGFTEVVTYIQSGNVVFKSTIRPASEVERKLSGAIAQHFGFEVHVVILTLGEMKKILEKNPFTKVNHSKGERVYFTILERPVKKVVTRDLENARGDRDEIQLSNRVVYLLCRSRYSKTVYNNSYFEKELKIAATTRNIETFSKLIAMGNETEGK